MAPVVLAAIAGSLAKPRAAAAAAAGGTGRVRTGAACAAATSEPGPAMPVDGYPGTAEGRRLAGMERAKGLTREQLDAPWSEVRRNLLWAAGLKDMTDVPPGMGNTGHCFADFNHCDATTMDDGSTFNENDGSVRGIAVGNRLGKGIVAASDASMGAGGSWCTCILGANQEPPQDVAHVQFQSKVAWKLVWSPKNDFASFALVDDAGSLLNVGTPADDGTLPPLRERQMNYEAVKGGRYARAVDAM